MSPAPGEVQERRLERLAAIADQHTEMIHDEGTAAQLAGREPVARYAAVTSEGSPESMYSANGNLIVAASAEELAGRLAREVGEGWPSHGRACDLDGGWDPWGNLAVEHRVELRPAPGRDGAPAPGVR